MPKKKLTPDQIQENFMTYKSSPEFQQIEAFMVERRKIELIEAGTKDISEDLTAFLGELFKMTQVMKVPGRKAKCT